MRTDGHEITNSSNSPDSVDDTDNLDHQFSGDFSEDDNQSAPRALLIIRLVRAGMRNGMGMELARTRLPPTRATLRGGVRSFNVSSPAPTSVTGSRSSIDGIA